MTAVTPGAALHRDSAELLVLKPASLPSDFFPFVRREERVAAAKIEQTQALLVSFLSNDETGNLLL